MHGHVTAVSGMELARIRADLRAQLKQQSSAKRQDPAARTQDWPGQRFGVRPTLPDEAPLSDDEARLALRLGIATRPKVRRGC